MLPDIDEFLGVDVGSARIGIARGSIRARIAEPLISIPAEKAVEGIAELARQHHAGGIVIGMPRGLNGQETEQTASVKAWAMGAKQELGLPCFWQDEALTSREASKNAKGKRKIAVNSDEHAVAAAIILQDFLDTPVKNRVII